jgi:import inner membrane translocase subunit TIM21
LVTSLSCTRARIITPISRATAWRTYATHSDRVPPSGPGPSTHSGQNATTDSTAELLRRLEAESRKQGGSTGFGGRESVGPFPLGVGPSGRRKMWRPWRELGVSGKCELLELCEEL